MINKQFFYPALSMFFFPFGILCFYYCLKYPKKSVIVTLVLSVSFFLILLDNNPTIDVLMHVNLLVFLYLVGIQRRNTKSINIIHYFEKLFVVGASVLVLAYYLVMIVYQIIEKSYPVQLSFGKLPFLYLDKFPSFFAIMILSFWMILSMWGNKSMGSDSIDI